MSQVVNDVLRPGSPGRKRDLQSPALLEGFKRALDRYADQLLRNEHSTRGYRDAEGVWCCGLYSFVQHFWHVIEPETPMVPGWPMEAICQHLEAVTFGDITRLLMNVSPGSCKSLLVDVFWPAWEWAIGYSHYRYVTFSYSASLTERDNGRFRDLIASAAYQRLYGDVVTLRNKTTLKVINTATGWKLASSVGGVGTGERGDRIILDDPHNVKDAESQIVRDETVRWFRESMSNRLNDLEHGAIVIIMQRVHEDDVSGAILALRLDYCHLLIPMEHEYAREPNEIGWSDPRDDGDDAEILCWPERFSAAVVERTKREVGPYAWAGQYQQTPAPRGGGIFKREWWQEWRDERGKFPVCDLVIASLDGAFTENEENSACALTVWGIFTHPEHKRRRIILLHAWRKHLQFSGARIERLPHEIILPEMHEEVRKARNQMYRGRCMSSQTWGLIEWTRDTCVRFKVDRLLIEAKASGMSAARELRSRYGNENYAVHLCKVTSDKYARAQAAQPTFSQELVYAPWNLAIDNWYTHAETVIDEMAVFPKGKYDDLTDSATQAIKHLRDLGFANTDDEASAIEIDAVTHKPQPKPLYPV